MKKFILPIAFFSSLLWVSCGETETKPSGDGETDAVVVSGEIDLSGLREFDMTPYDLNAIIYIPEKFYTDENQEQKYVQPDIEHNDGEALWIVTIPGDKNFKMEIEDWGSKEQTVALEKLEHEDKTDIYDFIYSEEGPDYLIYQRVLKSENTTLSQEDLKGMPNYHFFAVKFIDNGYVTFKTHTMEDYRLPTVRQMLNCARGSKPSK
jgi:hypothetical protein